MADHETDDIPESAAGISNDPALAARIVNAHVRQYINSIRTEKENQVQQTLAYLAGELASIKASIEKSENDLRSAKLNDLRTQYQPLERETEFFRKQYDDLLGKVRETEIAAVNPNIILPTVTPAEIPRIPIGPNKTLNIVVGIAVGLVTGIASARVQESRLRIPLLRRRGGCAQKEKDAKHP